MSSISKVVVVQHDPRAADAVRLGFEREGASVVTASDGPGAIELVDGDTKLVVAGAEGEEPARALLGSLSKHTGDAPILWVGNGVRREEAWAAGADEVLAQPAFVRDVVTIGKLIGGRKKGYRATINGDLGDYFGVFYMVRALAATGRSGVLTLVRGLRRGEMRLFEGEVTSAAMGGLHGQAGFHQLLLWSEARFEWRHERVVRRQQLPLPHDEVLQQAEKFLHDIRTVSGGLSPASVYEQDVAKIQSMARKLPTEVHGVLRLFDGNRTMADVLEDSAFRVFETLRVALRAVEVGLLKQVETTRPKAAVRAMLAVDEWLVGGESKDAVIDRALSIPDSAPAPQVPANEKTGGKKKNKGKRKSKDLPTARPLPPEVDWSAVVPKSQTVDMSSVTGVVPAAAASGEFVERVGAVAALREGREGLEALMDADERSRMFPATVTVDLGPDPDPTPLPGTLAPPEPAPEPVVASEESAAATAPIVVPEPVPEPVVAKEPSADVAAALADVKDEPGDHDEDAEWKVRADVAREEHPEPTEPIPKEELVEPPAVVVEPELLAKPPEEPAAEPAEPPAEPLDAEPAMLAVDLAFAQAAVAVVAEREAARPITAPPVDTHDPATSAEISAVRLDAVAVATHFSDDEEAFFNAGKDFDKSKPFRPVESFDDLDEGYKPQSFWERFRGKPGPKK